MRTIEGKDNITKIKLCGMMRHEDIVYANEAMPDYVGFVFANTRRRITRQQAKEFKWALHKDIKAVGVFVDADVQYVGELLRNGIIDIAQLHGQENQDYIERLKDMSDKPVIKAVKVTNSSDIENAARLPVEYLLLDTYKKGVLGGTGERFDWDIIEAVRDRGVGSIGGKPFFLAGGLTLDNICEAQKVGAYGLDISSGIEKDGCKDREKMLAVVDKLRRRK